MVSSPFFKCETRDLIPCWKGIASASNMKHLRQAFLDPWVRQIALLKAA